jgi:hypothetical protein
VNVGLVDPRTVAEPWSEMDAFTNQAFDIAKRFALYLAQMGQRYNKSLDASRGSLFRMKLLQITWRQRTAASNPPLGFFL